MSIDELVHGSTLMHCSVHIKAVNPDTYFILKYEQDCRLDLGKK